MRFQKEEKGMEEMDTRNPAGMLHTKKYEFHINRDKYLYCVSNRKGWMGGGVNSRCKIPARKCVTIKIMQIIMESGGGGKGTKSN